MKRDESWESSLGFLCYRKDMQVLAVEETFGTRGDNHFAGGSWQLQISCHCT